MNVFLCRSVGEEVKSFVTLIPGDAVDVRDFVPEPDTVELWRVRQQLRSEGGRDELGSVSLWTNKAKLEEHNWNIFPLQTSAIQTIKSTYSSWYAYPPPSYHFEQHFQTKPCPCLSHLLIISFIIFIIFGIKPTSLCVFVYT